MTTKAIPIVVLSAFVLVACQQAGTKETIGTVGGAIAGGVIGAQFGGGTGQLIATGVGTLLGALAGREIGRSLDRADELAAERAAQQALENSPTGQSVIWTNPDNGHTGKITPTGPAQTATNGDPCRKFSHQVTVEGETETLVGTACRNSNGVWYQDA